MPVSVHGLTCWLFLQLSVHRLKCWLLLRVSVHRLTCWLLLLQVSVHRLKCWLLLPVSVHRLKCWLLLPVSVHRLKCWLLLRVSVHRLTCWLLLLQVSVYWYLGRALCDMWVSMDLLCCTASILHLVAIAVDRFWAVSNIDYIRRRCARQILLMIAIVWLVSVAISIPPLFGWRHETDNPELTGVCMISQDHGYTIFSTVGAFYFPLVLMLVLNFKIYRAARYRIRRKGFMARHNHRPAHVPVPAVHVQEDTTARDTRNSSGSDVSQDGISMFHPSCIVNHEVSHVDTGFDSNTGDYEQQSYYPGDSTTDSNPNESYYPVDTEDPSPPPTPPPTSPSFILGVPFLEMASEASDRLCVESSPSHSGSNHLLSPDHRTLSSNHLTVPGAHYLAVPAVSLDRLSVPGTDSRKHSFVESLSSQESSSHLAVPESSEIEVPDLEQVTVAECEAPVATAAAAADSRLVQFDNRVRVEGDTDVSETSNSLKAGEEDGTSGEAQEDVEGDGDLEQDGRDGGDDDQRPDRVPPVINGDDVQGKGGGDSADPCGRGERGNSAGGDERSDRRDSADGVDRRDRRNSGDDAATTTCCSNNLLSVELSCMHNGNRHHRQHHQRERKEEAPTVEPPVIVRTDSCSQFMSESRCLNTPSFHSVSSPSTTTTTTSGTCSGHGNQLTVPGLGTAPAPQPVKARANNNTKRARNREKEKQRREKLEMRRERKAARVLGIITGAFVLCWLPFFILALVGPFLPSHCFVPPVLASLFLWLGYFNSLINPVIYTVFNPSFRNAFRKIFFKRMRSVARG